MSLITQKGDNYILPWKERLAGSNWQMEELFFEDEIGELPVELQSKLLRVLQEGEFERLGNAKKCFSYSLSAVEERKEDIPFLVKHFCQEYELKVGKKVTSIPSDLTKNVIQSQPMSRFCDKT